MYYVILAKVKAINLQYLVDIVKICKNSLFYVMILHAHKKNYDLFTSACLIISTKLSIVFSMLSLKVMMFSRQSI